MATLATTNLLLGILTAIAVLEMAAVVAALVLGVFAIRRLVAAVEHLETRHIAPASARVQAILGDVNEVTTAAKQEAFRLGALLKWATRWTDRANPRRTSETTGGSRGSAN